MHYVISYAAITYHIKPFNTNDAILYHTIPFYTIWCHFIPHHFIWHHIIAYHIILYHISLTSYYIMSYHIIPYHNYHFLLYDAISYHTMSYHIISYHAMPYHTISCNIIVYLMIPYYFIAKHYHTMIPHHSLPYHTIPYPATSYHLFLTIRCHIIPCLLPRSWISNRFRRGDGRSNLSTAKQKSTSSQFTKHLARYVEHLSRRLRIGAKWKKQVVGAKQWVTWPRPNRLLQRKHICWRSYMFTL